MCGRACSCVRCRCRRLPLLQEGRRDESGGEADCYLFDLDHFVLLHADPGLRAHRARLPPLPFQASEDSEHLVVDAYRTGGFRGVWGTGGAWVVSWDEG